MEENKKAEENKNLVFYTPDPRDRRRDVEYIGSLSLHEGVLVCFSNKGDSRYYKICLKYQDKWLEVLNTSSDLLEDKNESERNPYFDGYKSVPVSYRLSFGGIERLIDEIVSMDGNSEFIDAFPDEILEAVAHNSRKGKTLREVLLTQYKQQQMIRLNGLSDVDEREALINNTKKFIEEINRRSKEVEEHSERREAQENELESLFSKEEENE